MIFREELADKILAGEKTQTRRRMSDNPRSPWYFRRCSYRAGETYSVQPGRGKKAVGLIRVRRIAVQLLGTIDATGARNEGFAGVTDFLQTFEKINGQAEWNEPVWVLTFEVDQREET